MRIAYLMSQYPAVSHTFFLREVLGLRRLGIQIETASINTPPPFLLEEKNSSEAEHLEAASTFYLKQTGHLQALATAFSVLVLRPAVFFRGLAAAIRLRPQRRFGLAYALAYFIEALLLGQWMRRRNLPHLHIHFATAVATVGCIAAAAYRIPVSLTVHGADEFFDASLYALPQKIAQASFLVCISDFCRSQLLCLSQPHFAGKMHVVRLGVDLDEFTPATLEASTNLKLLCVGRLASTKGHIILLQSLVQLRAQNIPVELTLVGDGPLLAELTTFTQQNALETSVHFAGSTTRAQTRALLAQSQLFVLASFAEGVPVALMEAMAMELPCISTNIAGIPELIHTEHDGLLVPASSVEALTHEIARLAADPTLRRALGTQARATVSRNYNLTTNLTQLAALFHQQIKSDIA
jgi:colanic acid/amylovoran biosynthesis glycosyltransferase